MLALLFIFTNKLELMIYHGGPERMNSMPKSDKSSENLSQEDKREKSRTTRHQTAALFARARRLASNIILTQAEIDRITARFKKLQGT